MESLTTFWTENEEVIKPLVWALFILMIAYQLVEAAINARRSKRVNRQIFELRWNAERLGFVSDHPRSVARSEISMKKPVDDRAWLWLSCSPGSRFIPKLYMLDAGRGIDTMAGHVVLKGSSPDAIRSAVRQLLEDLIYAGKVSRSDVPEEMMRPVANH